MLLHTPTPLRLERLRQRETARFGRRIAPGGDMEQNHREFLDWAAAYDTGGEEMRSLARHTRWLAALPCPTLELDGSLPLDALTQAVMAALPAR